MLTSCDRGKIDVEAELYDLISKSIVIVEKEILMVRTPPPIDPNEKTYLYRYDKFCDTITYHHKTIIARLSNQIIEEYEINPTKIDTGSSGLTINNKKIDTYFPITTMSDTILRNMHYRNCFVQFEHPVISKLTAFVGVIINIGTHNFYEHVIVFQKKGDNYNWQLDKCIALGFR